MNIPIEVPDEKMADFMGRVYDVLEGLKDTNCYQPYSVRCQRQNGIGQWCEPCQAREILADFQGQMLV